MSHSIGLKRYILPIFICSKFSFLTSSCVIYRALNPSLSAIQTAGIYGFFLHSLYAFFNNTSVSFFSCAMLSLTKYMNYTYKYFMYHVFSSMNHVIRNIKYICNMVHITCY